MDSTHPLTPSAREGEFLDGCFASLTNPADCHDSRCESRNDGLLESFESANSKIVDEFLGLCEANE